MTCGSNTHDVTPCGMPWREPMRFPSVWLSPAAAGPGSVNENQAPS